MKKNEIIKGGLYRALVNGNLVTVRVDAIREGVGPKGNQTRYDVTNLKTGRRTVFASAQKFRGVDIFYKPSPQSEGERIRQANREQLEADRKAREQEQAPKEPKESPQRHSKELEEAFRRASVRAPHVIVEARAGTGKTTTLIEGLKELKGIKSPLTPSPQQKAVWDAIKQSGNARFVCFVAFNKAIAEELRNRVPEGCDAKTLHGLGYGTVRKSFPSVQVDSYRTRELLAEIMEVDLRDLRRDRPTLISAVEKLVDLCKMNLVRGIVGYSGYATNYGPGNTDVADVQDRPWEEVLTDLAAYYDVDLNGDGPQVFRLVPQILERAKRVDLDNRCDFADMIWLPVVLNLPVFVYDLLLVDEAQDLNRCQQALARKAGRRLILCGDPKQAIYGFAGADCESMPRMEKELKKTPEGCIHLPLTVTRRCGKAIVTEANRYVPDFQAHEGNGPGRVYNAPFKATVSSITFQQGADGVETTLKTEPLGTMSYLNLAEDKDMILCRVNAPLVSECFRILKTGRKATIQGRDIGENLLSLIKKLKAFDIADLRRKLEDWEENQVKQENAKKSPSDSRLQAIGDKVDCLVCFCEECRNIEDLMKKISDIFSDESKEGIKLSSVHKAKGLEARRVFLIRTKDAPMPHPMAKTPWQVSQEYNLLYVAITRAIEELVYVS